MTNSKLTFRTADKQMCVVRRVSLRLAVLAPGQQLWPWSAYEALKCLRRLLTLLFFPEADRIMLKAFRAGKATALAVAGKSLGTILAAGEWRSSAFLRYVDEDEVDRAQLLSQVLDASEGEEEL